MMLPKLDTFVLLTNEGPSLDKKHEPWSKFKHGDDGMRIITLLLGQAHVFSKYLSIGRF